MNFFNDLGS